MRALVRLAGIAVVGIALFYAGTANGILLMRPDPLGAALVSIVVAWCLALLVWLVSGTGRGDAASTASARVRRGLRVVWLTVVVFAGIGVAMLLGVLAPAQPDATPYHNDAIALNECAARMVLRGQNPYASLDLFACYEELGIGPDRTTPLRRGLFRDVTIYPNEEQLQAVWALRRSTPAENVEFEWRPSYPALSILALVPWVRLGLDSNLLSALLLTVGIALIVARTEGTLRPFMVTAVLGSVCLFASTVGGATDLFYATPLLVAWLWRERRWSAAAVGVAVSMKQLAWFVAPYYFLATLHERGWREALRRVGIAGAVFVASNLPFVLADAGAWFSGVATPVLQPMFPRGLGIIALATNGAMPLPPSWLFVALEALAFAGGLIVAWVYRRRAPEVGIVLAYVPLYLAWRSLFSYFFLLPLFAAAALARMPAGALAPEHAAESGAIALAEGPRARSLLQRA